MKLLSNVHKGTFTLCLNLKCTLFALLFLSPFLSFSNCTVNNGETVFSSDDPFRACTGTITISGTLIIDSDYDISALVFNNLILDGGTIHWDGNHNLALPENLPLVITNGGALSPSTPGGACNANKTLSFGATIYGSCNGNSANFSFEEINANGGANLSAILPVELNYFDAEKKQNTVLLKWQTLSENNNASFIIERSVDGWRFEAIGQINGAGTTSEAMDYSFEDNKPGVGDNYYRLRQIDFDATETVSKLLVISFESTLFESVRISPNPAIDRVTVSHPSIHGTINLQLFNLYGQSIPVHYVVNENYTNFSLPANLTTGQYFIKIMYNKEVETYPLLVK